MNAGEMATALYREPDAPRAAEASVEGAAAAPVAPLARASRVGPALTPVTNEKAASVLYGDPVTAKTAAIDEHAATKADALMPEHEASSDIRIDVPDYIKADRAERENDPGHKLFGGSVYTAALPDTLFDSEVESEDAPPLTPEVKRAVIGELRLMAADLYLEAAEVKTIQQRAAIVRTTPVPAEKQQRDCVTGLNAAFGQDAAQALKDARALIARDTRVGKLIDSLNLGNDPETVLIYARAARRARAAGKLK
jgi:hypothetical protein